MSIILDSAEYRNAANNATIKVEKYLDKFARFPFWRIVVKHDSAPLANVVKSGLRCKPRRASVENLL